MEELFCPRRDERVGDLDVRGFDELVDGTGAEVGVELGLDRLAQALLDLGAQLGERLELARGTRQLVVERRQHRLLDLLERRLGRFLLAFRGRVRDRLRLARAHPAQASLDLLDEPAGADLDDVVALRLARLVHEVDDEDVAVLRGAVLDRRELGDGSLQSFQLAVDELLGELRARPRAPRGRPNRRPPAGAAPRPRRRS